MTTRLYYTDAYRTSFAARVVGASDDRRRIYLDQSAFYPTSGGQPNDLGRLGGIEVVDVVDEEDRVAHLLAAPLAAEQVTGEIDWARRFDLMQQHTAQHLLTAVLAELYGCQTVSVHFGPESATLDVDATGLSPEQIRKAELRANEVITENRPVEVTFEDAAAAAGLRKASERTGTLRIVTIARLDRSACGGTHVRATGEIGALLIRKAERVKKQVRLEFLAGRRAIRRARTDYDVLSGIAGAASVGVDEVPGIVAGQRDQLKAAQSARRALTEQLNRYRAKALYAEAAVDGHGLRRVLEQTAGATIEEVRGLAQAVTAESMVLFAGVVPEPATVVLAASADAGVDAAAVLREGLAAVGGKGGGTARLAQGGVPDPAALPAILRAMGFQVSPRG